MQSPELAADSIPNARHYHRHFCDGSDLGFQKYSMTGPVYKILGSVLLAWGVKNPASLISEADIISFTGALFALDLPPGAIYNKASKLQDSTLMQLLPLLKGWARTKITVRS